MPTDHSKSVQVTITAAGDHPHREAIHQVVNALSTVLDEPEISEMVTATIVTKIKKGAKGADE